ALREMLPRHVVAVLPPLSGSGRSRIRGPGLTTDRHALRHRVRHAHSVALAASAVTALPPLGAVLGHLPSGGLRLGLCRLDNYALLLGLRSVDRNGDGNLLIELRITEQRDE